MSSKTQKFFYSKDSRGSADFGWLQANYSFSFGSFYNPKRMGFGTLKVLNDDTIAPNKGFDTHPHLDMEIITIVLEGALEHKDSEGNKGVIKAGDVQIMSAGKGIYHSEFNPSDTKQTKLLQIWISPEEKGIEPRYDQKTFSPIERKNQWQTVVAPMNTQSEGIKINQKSWFSLLDIEQGMNISYELKEKENGAYFLVLEGRLLLADEDLSARDALGVIHAQNIMIEATRSSKILAIETPLGKYF